MSTVAIVVSGSNALISASDLSWLLEDSNLQRLQRLQRPMERLPARLLQHGRRQDSVAPCCRPPPRVRSHALHAAAAE